MSDIPTHDVSRKELAAGLARGEEAAFAELYDACADRLHRYLAARLGSPEAAGDVLQNAFLRAVKSRRRFRGVENPVAYLFHVARNEATRYSTKWQRKVRGLPADKTSSYADSGFDDAEMVATALGRVNPDDRELVELKVFANFTFREIAEIVDRPQATVATRYRRALESLREWLARQVR
jgi:RNA polymerase sigma-70 factor (ECF subfamily)